MAVSGLQGMTNEQILFELQQGAKFVRYHYCVSVIILTFRRGNVHFVRSTESRFAKGLPYTLLSLVLGRWGIPWGPIFTIHALAVNFGGGKDVTPEVMNAIAPRAAAASAATSQAFAAPPLPPPPMLR